jgi:hypothetical protein
MIVNNLQWTEASLAGMERFFDDSLDRTLETGVL